MQDLAVAVPPVQTVAVKSKIVALQLIPEDCVGLLVRLPLAVHPIVECLGKGGRHGPVCEFHFCQALQRSGLDQSEVSA